MVKLEAKVVTPQGLKYFGIEGARDFLGKGKMVKRLGWPSYDFIYLQIPAEINKNQIIDMKSMPTEVKVWLNHFTSTYHWTEGKIRFQNQVVRVKFNVIEPWSPTIDDLQAQDWCVVEPRKEEEEPHTPRCITFDKEAQDNLPEEVKEKMKKDREKADKKNNQ